MKAAIKVGVSACLLGEPVRYDGGNKHDHFITGTMVRFFSFVPVCPEVECGMTVPREAMRLEGDPAAVITVPGLPCHFFHYKYLA